MKGLVRIVVIVSLVIALVPFCIGQVPLCKEDCERLKPEARQHYNKAIDYMDHIYYEGALDEVRKAAELDPDNINLQFFLASLAQRLGKMKTSPEPSRIYYNTEPISYPLDDPQKYYTIAENTLLLIQKSEKLNKDQKARLESTLASLQKEKASIIPRDNRRKEVGYTIIMKYLKEIGEQEAVTPATLAGIAGPGATLSPQASPSIAPSPMNVITSPFGITSPSGATSPAPVTPPATTGLSTGAPSPFAPATSAPVSAPAEVKPEATAAPPEATQAPPAAPVNPFE